MKFGKLLRENKIRGWEKYYVEYHALKKLIAICTLHPTKQDIDYFQQRVSQDIYKIAIFFKEKQREFRAQFKHLKMIAKNHNLRENVSPDSPQAETEKFRTEWLDFQTTARRLVENLKALKHYGHINSEGLRKIVKKYDKRCRGEGEKMTESFVMELQQQPFHRQENLAKLSDEVNLFVLTLPILGEPVHLPAKSTQALNRLRIVRDLLDNTIKARKEVVVPIAVEPRTYMANERTFLKWMRVSATAVTAGVGLITFLGHAWEFMIPGIILLVFGIGLMIRSWMVYRSRMNAMVNRTNIKWNDEYGACVVGFTLVVPVVFYLVFIAQWGVLAGYIHGKA